MYAPTLGGVGARVTLSPEESHYLMRVCRVRAGEQVYATDGRGAVAALRVAEARAPIVAEVETLSRHERRRDSVLLCGAPEGERADWMVEKLAEMGIGAFLPIQCERGAWNRVEERIERWRRLARAALRQSRGRFEMEIRLPAMLDGALDALPHELSGWLADSEGKAASLVGAPTTGGAAGAVGPAAGFSGRERAALQARGFGPISLSANRLRTETAAVAWAAWWASPGDPT